jgi:hypothetical protein
MAHNTWRRNCDETLIFGTRYGPLFRRFLRNRNGNRDAFCGPDERLAKYGDTNTHLCKYTPEGFQFHCSCIRLRS